MVYVFLYRLYKYIKSSIILSHIKYISIKQSCSKWHALEERPLSSGVTRQTTFGPIEWMITNIVLWYKMAPGKFIQTSWPWKKRKRRCKQDVLILTYSEYLKYSVVYIFSIWTMTVQYNFRCFKKTKKTWQTVMVLIKVKLKLCLWSDKYM